MLNNLTAFGFKPGVVKDDADYSTEGRFTDTQLVRFYRGQPQRMGGWTPMLSETFEGKCRGLFAWQTTRGQRRLALGTHTKLYAVAGGSFADVTPERERGRLFGDQFATSSGSNVVTVTHIGHGLAVGDVIEFRGEYVANGVTISQGPSTLSTDIISVRERRKTATFAITGHGYNDKDTLTITGAPEINGLTIPDGDYKINLIDADNFSITAATAATADGVGGTGTTILGPTYVSVSTVVDTSTYEIAGSGSASETGSPELSVAYTYPDFASGNEHGKGGGGYGVGGYGTGTYGGGSSSPDLHPRTWSLHAWGEHLLAQPYGGAFYLWEGDTTKTAEPQVSAPERSLVSFITPERHAVACGTVDLEGKFDPLLIRWSDRERLDIWYPTATNTSRDYKLAEGATIVGASASSQENLVWTDTALYSMRYTNHPYWYTFTLRGTRCGLIGPHAAVTRDGVAFWMSPTGEFYVYDGGAPRVITDCPVRDFVFSNIGPGQHHKVWAFANPEFHEVGWLYPSFLETDSYVLYNYAENTWATGTLDRTVWLGRTVFNHPIAATSSGSIFYQDVGNSADGGAIHAWLETGPIDLSDGNRVMRCDRYVPDFKMAGALQVTLKYQDFPTSAIHTSGPHRVVPDTEYVDVRWSGRTLRLRVESKGTQDKWRMGRQRFSFRRGGIR